MPQIKLHQILLNRYRVDEFVAVGGMGAVYKVYDLIKNTPLAMKVMNIDLEEEDTSSIKRFKREARAYRNLMHPNIVPYYGFEQTEDAVFMLLKYIDGDSLKNILGKPENKPFPVLDTLIVLKAVCAALGYAHTEGVVHCDIKPGNILVDLGGNIYLTDFGIARHAESSATQMPDAGTAAYMAPEQYRGEIVTAATDVYGLGIMIYEVLTGQRPFKLKEKTTVPNSKSSREIYQEAHLKLQVPDPCGIRPDLPKALGQVLLKSLSKASEDRYQSAQELFTAICRACNVSPEQIPDRMNPALILTSSNVPSIVAVKPLKVSIPTPEFKITTTIKKNSNLYILGLGVIVIAGVVLIAVFSGNGISVNERRHLNLPYIAGTSTDGISQEKYSFSNPVIATPVLATPTSLPTATATPNMDIKAGATQISPSDGAVMVYIRQGEFQMGSPEGEGDKDEHPQHTLNIDGFWMDRTEVTNSQFEKFVQASGYRTYAEEIGYSFHWVGASTVKIFNADWLHPRGPSSSIDGLDYHPVVHVTWNDAVAYCTWAGKRLPTEAEWEKAARGPEGYRYPWGNVFACDKGNFDDETNIDYLVVERENCDGYARTAPVGSFPNSTNAYGVLDLSGNVWEWVFDWYAKDYYYWTTYDNPQGPTERTGRGVRGGSWYSSKDFLRSSFRDMEDVNLSTDNTGFRCVKDAY